MCVFMGNDVFDQIAGRTGEFGVVGDVAVAPMAATPERLHLADLPRDPVLAHTSRPRCVQFAEERPQDFQFGFRHRGAYGGRTRQHLGAGLLHPPPLLAQEVLALPQRRPPLRNRETHRAVRRHADVDPADALADDLDGYAIDLVVS